MNSSLSVRARAPLVLCLFIVLGGCNGNTPAPTQPTTPTPQPTTPAPTPPAVTVASVRVGTAGNVPPTLTPGTTLQFFAEAVNSDGTVTDVTNVARWQSSNPAVATVSPTGLLTAAIEGSLDVTATHANQSGSLHADVQKAGCRVTLSPASLVFSAFSNGTSVTVTTTLSTCRWKATSDASWLPVQSDPNRSGNGFFSYSIPTNNNVDAREAHVTVTVEGGPAAIHTVRQERPVGCVYQVSPEKLTFNPAGGRGEFNVITIPGDCQWRITDTFSDITVVGPTSGAGSATVVYNVRPNAFQFDHTFRVQGLSGLNPPAVHTAHVRP